MCIAVDLRQDAAAAVYRGQPKAGLKPDCKLTISDSDFVELAAGKLTGTKVHRHCVVMYFYH